MKSTINTKEFLFFRKVILCFLLFIFLILNNILVSFARDIQYIYDSLNRLVEVHYPDKIIRYTYDAAGNRTDATVENLVAAPAITSLSPNSATTSGTAFILTVNGADFTNGSVVKWNGESRPTTLVNANQLTANIPASDIAAVGTATIAVLNQTANSISTAQFFTIQSGASDCSYTTNPTSALVTSSSVTGIIAITAPVGCAWSSSTNDSWITISSGSSGSGTGISTYSVTANPGAARTGTITIAGQNFTVNQAGQATLNIGGSISYGITPVGQTTKQIAGVWVSANGESSASATSDPGGTYSLNGLPSGTYTVTPAKTGDVNSISSFDASLVARKAANLITLMPNQLIAADVSNNGAVSSFDASLIARTVAGIANPGIAGQWKFAPVSRTYASLASNQTAQNYDAILMGEVSGNWTPPATANNLTTYQTTESDKQEESQYRFNFFSPNLELKQLNRQSNNQFGSTTTSTNAPEATINVSIPANTSASKNTTVIIPVTVGDTTGADIFSYDFTVSFDPNVLQPATQAFDTANTLSGASGLTITPNSSSGQLTISGFGSQPLTGAGPLIFLRFNVIGTPFTTSGWTNLTFSSFTFNEGDPAANITNGQFTVTPPTTADVSVGGRVLATSGRGISNVSITLTDTSGMFRTATTTSFGYYRFDDLLAGQTYIISVRAKKYNFTPNTQVVFASEDTDNIDFVGNSFK